MSLPAKDFFFSTSWDDGHPLDLRLGELLRKHRCAGTFYVPCRNLEGKKLLSPVELRQLGEDFEIGGHTLDHSPLDRLNKRAAVYQIEEGKKQLEQGLEKEVKGFCYPGGRYHRETGRLVREAGFFYARTTFTLAFKSSCEPWSLPTTVQFYPHSRQTLLRSFLKRGHFFHRLPMALKLLESRDLLEALTAAFELALAKGRFFHLWGHSWEIEEFDGWSVLDSFLAHVAERVPQRNRIDNLELSKAIVREDRSWG